MDSNFDIISLIYLIGVLILILPSFLKRNSQFKTLLQNIKYRILNLQNIILQNIILCLQNINLRNNEKITE